MCVEASRIETHRDRLVELKRLLVQLDDYRFETLKYLCAHFRKVASKCDINKVSLLALLRPSIELRLWLDRCEKSGDHLRSDVDLGFESLVAIESRR